MTENQLRKEIVGQAKSWLAVYEYLHEKEIEELAEVTALQGRFQRG